MRLVFFYCALSLFIPNLCFRIFDSRSPVVKSVIEKCVSNTRNEKLQCNCILRCIIDHSPSEVFTRWSAGPRFSLSSQPSLPFCQIASTRFLRLPINRSFLQLHLPCPLLPLSMLASTIRILHSLMPFLRSRVRAPTGHRQHGRI